MFQVDGNGHGNNYLVMEPAMSKELLVKTAMQRFISVMMNKQMCTQAKMRGKSTRYVQRCHREMPGRVGGGVDG
eukprot:14726410-Heterocapsa_arctica.AAC.1